MNMQDRFELQDTSAIDLEYLKRDYENIAKKDGTAPDVKNLYIRTVTDPNGMQHLKLEKHTPWSLGDWWKRLTHQSEYSITDTSLTGKRLQNLHNAFQLAPTKESAPLTDKDIQPQEAGNIKLSPETLNDILTSIKMRKESGKSASQKEDIEALFSTIFAIPQKTLVEPLKNPAGTTTNLQKAPQQEVAKPVLQSKKQIEENLTEIRQKLGDQAIGTYALSQDKDDVRFNYISKEGIVHVDFLAGDPHSPADVFGCIAQTEREYVKNAMRDKPVGTFCQVLSDEKQYLYVTLLDEPKEVEFSITDNGLLQIDGQEVTSPEEYIETLFKPHIEHVADPAKLEESYRPGRFCESPEKENTIRIIDESGRIKEVEYTLKQDPERYVDTSGTEYTSRFDFVKASIKLEPQEIDVISLEIPHFSPLEVKINQLKTIESLDTTFRYNVANEALNDLFQPFIPTADDYEKVNGKYTLKTPPPFLLRAGEMPGEFELITPRLTPPSDSIFSSITGTISWVVSGVRSIGEAVGAIEKQEVNPLTFQTIRVLEDGKIEGENGKTFEANSLGTLIYDAYASRSDNEIAAFNESKADAFTLKKDPKTDATIVSVRQQGKTTDFAIKKEGEGLTLKPAEGEEIVVEGELMTFLDSHFKVPHFGMNKRLLAAVEDFSEKGNNVHGLKRANTLLKPGYALSFPTYFTLSENATGTGLTLTKYPYSVASFGSGLSEEKYQINVLSSGKVNLIDAKGNLRESYSSIDAFRTTLNDPNSPSLKIKETQSEATVINMTKAKETVSLENSPAIAKTKMTECRALLGDTIENKCLISEQANTNVLVLTYWQKGKLQETKITVADKGFSLPAGWIASEQTFPSFKAVLTHLKIEPLNLSSDSSVSKDITSRKALLAKLPSTSIDAATKELSTYQDILAAKSPVLYTLCIKTLNDGMQTPCINYVDNQGALQSKTLNAEELAKATPENLENSLVALIGTEAKPLNEPTKNSLKSEKKAYEETKKTLSNDPGMANDLVSLEKSIKANEGIQGYRLAPIDNRGNYRVQWNVVDSSGKSILYTKNFSLTKKPGELTTDTGSHSTLIAFIRNISNPRLALNANMPALPNEKLAPTQGAKTTAAPSQTPSEQARNLQLIGENLYTRFELFDSSATSLKQAIIGDSSACRIILEKIFVPDGNKSITDPSVLREMVAFRDNYLDKKDILVALAKKVDILNLLVAERAKMNQSTTKVSPMQLLPLSTIADPTRKLLSLFRDHRGIAERILAGNLPKDESQVLLNRIFDRQPTENSESFRLKVLSALVDPDFKDYHKTLAKLIEKSGITPMTPGEREKIETDLYHLNQYETANEDLEAHYEELEAAQNEASLKETTVSKSPSKEELDVTVKFIGKKSPNTKVLWLAHELAQAEKAGKPYTKEQKQALISRTGTNTTVKMPTVWPKYLQRAGISNESQLRKIIQ